MLKHVVIAGLGGVVAILLSLFLLFHYWAEHMFILGPAHRVTAGQLAFAYGIPIGLGVALVALLAAFPFTLRSSRRV